MTLSELIYEVRSHLGDPFGQTLSELTIQKALRDAYKRFCQDTYATEYPVTFSVSAGTKFFRLPDWIAVVRDAYWERASDGTVTPLYPVSRYQVTSQRPDFHTMSGSGTPLYYFTLGINTFAFLPWPDSNGLFRTYSVVLPSSDPASPVPELVNPTDTPVLPEQFHIALVYGALERLYLRPLHPQHLELMEYWRQKYRQGVQECRRYIETFDDRSWIMNSLSVGERRLPLKEYNIVIPPI